MDVPFIESELSQLGRAGNSIQAAAGAAGVLNGAKIHFGKTNMAIDQSTTYAALAAQEADYDGYAAVAVVWGTPVTAGDNTVEVLSVAIIFAPSGDTTPNSIYNMWVSNAGSSAWYYAAVIPGGPLPMSTTLDQIVAILRERPAVQSLAVLVA